MKNLRAPRIRRQKSVAILVGLATAYGRDVIAGISQYTRENGSWHIHLDHEFSRWHFPPWLRDWHGDGIISRVSSEEMCEYSKKTGIPIIDLNERTPLPGLPLIYNNQHAVGELAAEHLLERGYTEFGYIGQQGYLWSDLRQEGFTRRVKQAGCHCSVFIGKPFDDRKTDFDREYRNSFWEQERPQIQKWIQSLPKPTGILACNSFRGLQLIEEAYGVGLAVPEQVAVISGDNEETLCEMVSPTLSGVILDSKKIGYQAAATLARIMNGESPDSIETYIPPIGIAIRGSTELASVTNPIIQKSLEYIRENARFNISVPDIADAVGLSTTKLQRLFRAELNKTVLDQILYAKINVAKILLKSTILSIEEIAIRSGFNHPQRFSEAFLRIVGIRPGKYRKS